jgi:transcriptional regulator with XRE-family HTH domain
MDAITCTERKTGGFVAFTDDFKRRLNAAFVASGLSRIEFADACNVSAPTVTRWLDARSPVTPELKRLKTVCDALDVKASDLIHGDVLPLSTATTKIAKARELARQSEKISREIAKILGHNDTPVEKSGRGRVKKCGANSGTICNRAT